MSDLDLSAGRAHEAVADSPLSPQDRAEGRRLEHELKTWPEFFRAIKAGVKRHEVRENDRDYRVGDVLVLREFEPNGCGYTGDEVRVRVTYATAAFLPVGMIAMSVALLAADEDRERLRDWQATVTAALRRPGGSFYEDVPNHVRELVQRAEAAEAALARVQAENEALRTENASLIEAAFNADAKVQAENARLRGALEKYGKHDTGCAVEVCAVCGKKNSFSVYMHRDKENHWYHEPLEKPCSCGLAAALSPQPPTPTQEGQ